jgi:hypothetical protein
LEEGLAIDDALVHTPRLILGQQKVLVGQSLALFRKPVDFDVQAKDFLLLLRGV